LIRSTEEEKNDYKRQRSRHWGERVKARSFSSIFTLTFYVQQLRARSHSLIDFSFTFRVESETRKIRQISEIAARSRTRESDSVYLYRPLGEILTRLRSLFVLFFCPARNMCTPQSTTSSGLYDLIKVSVHGASFKTNEL
jgi:hypothetical protein